MNYWALFMLALILGISLYLILQLQKAQHEFRMYRARLVMEIQKRCRFLAGEAVIYLCAVKIFLVKFAAENKLVHIRKSHEIVVFARGGH